MDNGYDLSRGWFNFCFDNPEKIKPIHSAIFFFAIEHCNRLGGKKKFGFPSQMTMDAIGIKNYQTYGKALKDISEWGFIVFIERSKNQYSANIISLSATTKNSIARGKALDKAIIKHGAKQRRGIVSIDKPINQVTNKPLNHRKTDFKKSLIEFVENSETPHYEIQMAESFFEYWTEHGEKDRKMRFEKEKSFGLSRRLATWFKNQKRFEKEKVAPKRKNEMLTEKMEKDYGIQ